MSTQMPESIVFGGDKKTRIKRLSRWQQCNLNNQFNLVLSFTGDNWIQWTIVGTKSSLNLELDDDGEVSSVSMINDNDKDEIQLVVDCLYTLKPGHLQL